MPESEAKQRLVDLDVGEVSIVDHPANEEPFVVTKAKTPAQDTEKSMGVQLDPLVAANVTFQTLQDMMWEAGRKMREGKQTEAMADLERITAMLDQVKQFTASVTKAATDIAAEVTKAKGDDKKVPAFMKEALKGAIDTLKAAMGEDEPDGDEATKTEKALEVILKAGKAQFSKERLAKLHEAFVHMGSMYKEASAEEFQKALDAWTVKTETKTETAKTEAKTETTKAEDAPPAWFTKSMEDIQKSIDDMKTSTQEVSKRVETIEKVEAVSKALPNNGTDKVQPVEKQDSFWKGVL